MRKSTPGKTRRTRGGAAARTAVTPVRNAGTPGGKAGTLGKSSGGRSSARVLVIDVGGTHVKVLASGETDVRRVDSGPGFTARQMAAAVLRLARDWHYEAVSIGYPGVVWHGRPIAEPHNLGAGWVAFNYEAAFGKPVRIINDAAMQAIGSYEGGRMLFLGLGTGLGSALILDGVLESMELGHLPYKKGRSYEEYLGEAGLQRLGKKRWRHAVLEAVERLAAAFEIDYVVLGGGNVAKLKTLPDRARRGENANAFKGGLRLWSEPRWERVTAASPQVGKTIEDARTAGPA